MVVEEYADGLKAYIPIDPKIAKYNEKEDIFVHYSAIRSEGYKTLVEGQYVKFELIRTDKGLQAKNVIELKTALV